MNCINSDKDVDRFNPINAGLLSQNTNPKFIPCTPLGCMNLLDYYNISVKNKNITIVGSSNLVGLPLSLLLHNNGATVTICNINTLNTREHTKNADVVIACCG